MSKKILVLFLMLSMVSNSFVSGMSISSKDAKKEDVVLDEKKSWDDSERPRSLDMLVWTCYYENGILYLNASCEVGWVKLTVTNLATGEVWSLRQASSLGWMNLQTSSDQGNYMVEVETESSGEYVGYYNL